VVEQLLCPSGARSRACDTLHGLRSARKDAGCAAPVATFLGPVGAKHRRPARGVSNTLRRQILERNGSTCQVRGAGAGEESLCEPGRKCRLEIDYTTPLSQGGTDEEHNLRAVCVYYNKGKSNLKVPTSRDAISAMALIRRQPRNVQQEVYEFLAKKFGKQPGAT